MLFWEILEDTECFALQGIMDLAPPCFMLIWIDKLLDNSFLGTSVANDFDPFLLKLKFMNFIQYGKLLRRLFFYHRWRREQNLW